MAALRRSTAQRHAAIEDLLALGSPFGLDHYGRVLCGFEAFLSVWEPAVARSLPEKLRPWFLSRCRSDLARRDLAALGLPRVPAPPAAHFLLPGLPAALGSLYVLEGSALGGQVIARQAARDHALGPQDGAAYFNGWGARTGAMWREFQQVLEVHDPGPQGRAQACASAQATFDGLSATFASVLHGTIAA